METENNAVIVKSNRPKLINALSNFLSTVDEENNKSNVKYINKQTYDKLGKYHKNMLHMFGMMLDQVKQGDIIDYHNFASIFQKLFENKTDTEKQYLFGLFFPKTIKHATFLNPL
jgi:hypothetical protein